MQLTDMQLARRAIVNFRHHHTAPRSLVNFNRRQWIRSIKILGTKWKMHPDNRRARLTVPLYTPIKYPTLYSH